MEHLTSFCKDTHLHGWQYMSDKSITPAQKAQKLFWSLVLFISICVATVLIYNNILVFRNATVVTTIETMNAPLTDVFFPSVSVCNINQARKSFFDEIGIYDNDTLIRKILSEYHGLDDGCSNCQLPKYVLDKLHNLTHAKRNKSLDWDMHQKCQDMFIFSKWNGSFSEGAHEIDHDFGTDYGICCWFTPQLNLTEVRKNFIANQMPCNKTFEDNWRMGQMDIPGDWFQNLKMGATTGKHNGFTMLVDIEAFDYNYSDEGAEGLKV